MRYTQKYLQEKYQDNPEQLDEIVGTVVKTAKNVVGLAKASPGAALSTAVKNLNPDRGTVKAAGFAGKDDPTMARAKKTVDAVLGAIAGDNQEEKPTKDKDFKRN